MQFLKPTLLASAGLLILAACEGGAGNIVSIPSPFTDVPNDGRSAYPDDGRSAYRPPSGSIAQGQGGSSSQGQGGSNQAGSNQGGSNQAGSGSGNAQLCALCPQIPTVCPDIAALGFTAEVCQAQCGSAPAGCEACVVAAQSCDAITSCLAGVCAGNNGQGGSNGQGGTDVGQGGTDVGQGGTDVGPGGTSICGQCGNISTCTDGQLDEASCQAQCENGVSAECANCVNAAGDDCDTLIGCFNTPECQ